MEGSLLESARQKAREIAAAYKADDQFQLITNDFAGGQFRWLSREEFLTAVDGLQTSAVTQHLSTVARRQNDFLRSASAANRHAYMVSDFQQSTADIENYPEDSTILTTFIPLGGSDVGNLFLDSLALGSPAYYPGAAVEVDVRVRNEGDKAVESLPLRLFVGDRQRAVATVDVPAHGSVSAKMVFTMGDEGVQQGYVETTDYPITFDDKLYFTLPVTQRVPMMVVSGAGENPFLKRLFSGDSLVEYRQESAGQIDYAHFSDQQLIVLDELHSIPSGLAQVLQDYVAHGGSLVVVPAQGAEVVSYNQMLALFRAPQLEAWVENATRAAQVETAASLFEGVFNGGMEDMEMPSVGGHYRLAASASTVVQPLIRLLDGGDYLTVTPTDGGRCYLFAAPLRREYTDFVQQALFVPVLYNMALFSTPFAAPYQQLAGAEPITLQHGYDVDNLPHLMDVGGTTDLIPDIRRMGSRSVMFVHDAVTHAGNYCLVDGGEALEGVSFNYSRAESVMAFYPPKEVKRLIEEMHPTNCSVASTAQKSMTDYIRQRSQGKPLWRLFLVLALGALLAETILIRRERG